MRAGIPLDDSDRAPWLAAVGAWIDGQRAAHAPGIIACSALKRAYRETLAKDRPEMRFIYLKTTAAILASRLAGRQGHFMPASLLDSQLATLEEPGPQEAIIVDGDRPAADVTAAIADRLRMLGIPTPSRS
jgi:carbohydrate kinase (thermoresistant glucokinase family)